jgi:hypothetical protein
MSLWRKLIIMPRHEFNSYAGKKKGKGIWIHRCGESGQTFGDDDGRRIPLSMEMAPECFGYS